MKRSGFPKKPFEERVRQAQEAQARQRARSESKPREKGSKWQEKANKPKSEAALAGKRRSQKKRAGKDARLGEFRRTCRERDNCTCQWPGCRVKDPNISVQHIAKRSQRPDLIYDPENGVCLCWPHHDLADNTVQGRVAAKKFGLGGTGMTYELARKGNQ